MTHTLVTYTVKPGREEENVALIRAVFDELAETRPAGVHYLVLQLRDSREFVHVYVDEGSATGLQSLSSFQAFVADAATRHERPARVTAPQLIGEYRGPGATDEHARPDQPDGRPDRERPASAIGAGGAVAAASVDIRTSAERVWAALTEPEQISTYSGGARVQTSWQVGSPITWSGEHNGRTYQDTGQVLIYDRPHVLSVSHCSPLMGQAGEPEQRHTIVYRLAVEGDVTHLALTQDGCTDEAQAERFSRNWQAMLDGLRSQLER